LRIITARRIQWCIMAELGEEAVAPRPDPARLRYWARLLKLLRDPWPSRSSVPPRTDAAYRSSEPTRQAAPTRLDEAV
jgi:hypothetical protein